MSNPTYASHDEAIDRATERAYGAWIDGQSHDAASGETFDVVDPAAGQPITAVPRCRAADIDTAVTAARESFEADWGERTPAERSQALLAWASELREHLEELALLECLEVGKPIEHARADVENGIEFFEYYASVARGHDGAHVDTGEDTHAYVRNEPYGVAGAVLPWNYPVLLLAWKVGAALAAGNAVVCKPAEQAPLAVIRAAQLAAGPLPDGLFNVVPGYGEEAGRPLTEHDYVDKLSFTGSVPVGKAVMRAAADTVTPVTLELGGKNPFVVFPDADPESAAATAAVGGLYNTGQSCDSASRLVVHEDIYDEFREELLAAYQDYEPADPLEEDTAMGPLCFEGQFEKVERYVDIGREAGATVLAGGEPAAGETRHVGLYYRPTVFEDVDPEGRLAQEEIFGPVQMLLPFDSYDEAIAIANGVDYGLTAGVATGDPSLAHRAAADLEAGSVWVNQYFGTVPGTPFGGFKQSGVGRECAQDALDEYTRTKAVSMALDQPEL